jgi:hypothetical protein
MAKRILPYRDYSEHDVVNLFSLDLSSATATTLAGMVSNGSGDFDAGVVVSVSAGAEIPQHDTTVGNKLKDYLGADYGSSHVGYHSYPYNGMTVAASNGTAPLGITLRETLAYDENGEKMLYYPQKLDEAQGILPGKSVPVLTKGLVLLGEGAFSASPALNDEIEVDNTNPGQLVTLAAGTSVGRVIAIGVESNDPAAGKYLCKLSF